MSNTPERGTGTWVPITDEEREKADTLLVPNVSVLKNIIPRLWVPAPLLEPVLALEVIDGPFAGVIFSYKDFEVLPVEMQDGWVPTKFGIKVWKKPAGVDVTTMEFDNYTREVLIAWLSYIALNDFKPLTGKPTQGIH